MSLSWKQNSEEKLIKNSVSTDSKFIELPTEINLAPVHIRLSDGKGSIKRPTP
jgi:hypothetical protein